jgi:hypothetical protein
MVSKGSWKEVARRISTIARLVKHATEANVASRQNRISSSPKNYLATPDRQRSFTTTSTANSKTVAAMEDRLELPAGPICRVELGDVGRK